MNLQELATVMRSRQRRTLRRNYEKIQKFLSRIEKNNREGKKIRTHLRDIPVVPQMIGMTINIHNGKTFVPIKITEGMIGHYLGEFSLTRRRVAHGAAGVGATKSSKAVKSAKK